MENKFVLIDKGEEYLYRVQKVIGTSTYKMDFHMNYTFSVMRFYIALYSGKKRKELNYSSLEKTNNSDGGLKALIWCKKVLIEFIKNHESIVRYNVDYKDVFIIVQWEDKKRRDIYQSRLKDLGFHMTHDQGNKCLKLKIK